MKSAFFQDLSPWHKLLMLFVFMFMSTVLFVLLAGELSQAIWGIDLVQTDFDKLEESQFADHRNANVLSTFLFQVGAFLMSTLAFFQYAEASISKRIGIGKGIMRGVDWVWVTIIGALLAFGAIFISSLSSEVMALLPGLNEMAESASEEYNSKTGFMLSGGLSAAALNVLVIGIIAPLCEEFFYRSGVQGYLLKISRKPWHAIVVTAIVFAIMHFEFTGFITRFTLGLVLGWVYYKSGSIWPSVIIHAGINTVQIILEYIQHSEYGLAEWVKIMPAACTLLAGISLYVLYRSFETR